LAIITQRPPWGSSGSTGRRDDDDNDNTTTPANPYKLPTLTGKGAPLQGVYKEQQALAQRAYEQAIASLGQQQGQLLRDFGYIGDVDQNTGVVSNLRMDSNNPFGAMQQAGRQQHFEARNARNDARERGLSSRFGLGRQGLSAVNEGAEFQRSQLTRQFLDRLQEVLTNRAGAGWTRDEQMLQAQKEAILQASSLGLYPQTRR
jgi:hypothetical protein